MKFQRRVALLIVALLACTAVLLGACVPNEAPDDRKLVSLTPSEEEVIGPGSDFLAENEYITINDVVSVTPTNVAVFGQLTELAISEGVDSVRITGGVDISAHEKCSGSYFIISVDLPGHSAATFAANAMKGEEEIGEPLTFSAPYDATAEERLDGNSVSVGKDSRLYFTKYLSDYLGKELYTASQVSEIKSTVASTYKAYLSRAKGNQIAMIYVFLPDMTTLDPSVFHDDDAALKDPDLLTRYQQIVNAVGGTMATVVDMQTVLQAELDAGKDIYDLYRQTDSHPTEYTSFLMYREVMKHIAALDSDVTPYTLDDFDMESLEVLGGDLVSYRELDNELITETITLLKPKFSYIDGVKNIRVYNDPENGDYTYFTTVNSTDAFTAGVERVVVKSERTKLPNLLVYRDENAIGASLLLANSCDQTVLVRSGDFNISLTDAGQYRDKEEGKSIVDFIVVFVSESNMGTAFRVSD